MLLAWEFLVLLFYKIGLFFGIVSYNCFGMLFKQVSYMYTTRSNDARDCNLLYCVVVVVVVVVVV